MGVDDFGHAAAADTVGAGNAAAEILVSTGTLQMAELTLYKTFPKYFFRFTPKVTGGHKNSYGRIQGCLWYKNT
jgi:hypothetical protein